LAPVFKGVRENAYPLPETPQSKRKDAINVAYKPNPVNETWKKEAGHNKFQNILAISVTLGETGASTISSGWEANPLESKVKYFMEYSTQLVMPAHIGLMVLIWLVQLIIYPTFHKIPENDFRNWHRIYCRRIGYIVLPLMLGQVIFTIGYFMDQQATNPYLPIALAMTWIITFAISAPIHDRLQKNGKDPIQIKQLIQTNWYRTILWTLIPVMQVLLHG
jgi:hypothetical protein